MYQDKHEYNVIKGIIPDFGYDVKFAVVVDGNKTDKIPTTPKGKDNLYYSVDVKCPSSKTEGLWDYNAWKLNLDYIESNSKCNLTFTSNLTEADYDKYIEAGIAIRRNTYRGKDITDYKKLDSTDKMNLYNQIGNCTFDDIYVGDYIKGSNGVTWLIADINNYLNTGNKDINAANGYKSKAGTGLKACHATVIPASSLEIGKMNPSNTTEGGYLGSEMATKTLPKISSEKVEPDFSGHIITYRNLLSNAMDKSLSNQYGSGTGASSGWDWVDRQIDLMSEVNVYGSTVWSSSGYDIGIDNRQYAIFHLKPNLINTDGNGKGYWYWLKAVAGSADFARVDYAGAAASNTGASNADGGIRPRFLID